MIRCHLFANDHGTAFVANPDLMNASCIDIHASTGAKRLLLTVLFLGIPNGHITMKKQVRSQSSMFVWRIICASVTFISLAIFQEADVG